MNKKKTMFQMVVAGIFGVLLLIGFVLFATYKPHNKLDDIKIGKVVIWGTLDENIVNKILVNIRQNDERFLEIEYQEKSKSTYNQDILEALAAQKSPDLILLSNQDFLKNRNKIYPIKNISKRQFYDTFTDAFSIYLAKDGVLGIPFIIDPMVMYYNKTMFSSNRVVLVPRYWEDFEENGGLTTKIRRIGDSGNILKSAIAFGEGENITSFKEILYTLFLQKNNFVIKEGNGVYESDKNGFKQSSDIINFYTQFANQVNKVKYSWNRSMPQSIDEFMSENLATYFGFASDLLNIRYRNPNLNFDVAEMPTFKKSNKKVVYANTWVFSIPKGSQNKTGAFQVALKFSSKESQEILKNEIHLPPVRKDMLSELQEDQYMDIFYKESIYAYSILGSEPKKMNNIFDEYITNVNTGLKSPVEATEVLSGEIDQILKKYRF